MTLDQSSHPDTAEIHDPTPLKKYPLRAALLFAYGFGNAAAYIVARTVADSEFLSRVGPQELPKVYLASAGVVALTSAVYARIVRGASIRGSVIATLAVLSAVTAGLPLLINAFPFAPLTLTTVYLVSQVRGSLGTIHFTMLLNEQFAQRQPERVVGILGGGATLAGFTLGILLGHFGDLRDLTSLLYIVALIDLATMIPVRLLPPGQKFDAEIPDGFLWLSSPTASETEKSTYPWKIAAMISVGVMAATLVEFQWKVSVAEEYHRSEVELARYFGAFYGWVYLITGVVQFLMASRVLRARGAIAGLLSFPISLLLTGVGVLSASGSRTVLWAMTFAKGCDALKRGVYDPAVHLLYSPLPSDLRHQVVTFVAGIAKPLTEALASVLLIIFAAYLPSSSLSLAVIPLTVIWSVLATIAWKGSIAERRKLLPSDDSRTP